jgi:hypothetical protein
MFHAPDSSALTSGSARDVLTNHWDRIALPPNNPRDRSAKSALAGNTHNLALTVLAVLLPALGKPVRGPNARAEIGAVDFHFTSQLAASSYSRAHRLAELVEQNEGRFRVDIHVAGHPQRGDAFDAIAEKRDHREVVSD